MIDKKLENQRNNESYINGEYISDNRLHGYF